MIGSPEQRFAKEADLCAAFIAALPREWTAYPEWAGWDILLSGPQGIQVGIEAKLALNATVLEQAMESDRSYRLTDAGPDFRAVLVPRYATGRLARIAAALGIVVIRMHPGGSEGVGDGMRAFTGRGVRTAPFQPPLPSWGDGDWFDHWPWRRADLPEVIPDCAAGCPAPLRLTDWKVRAIKLAILIDRRGHVTRADFKSMGVSMSRWTQCWLVRGEVRGTWVWGKYHPDFRREHPKNYDEIADLFEKWAPPEAPLLDPTA